MKKHLPLTDKNGEVSELTSEALAQFRPASKVLPSELFTSLVAAQKQRQRGAQKAPLKVPTTIRFDADVLLALKASGKGWQTRVNDIMRERIKSHSLV